MHTPTRMCVICRRRFAKQSLTRMVRDARGDVVRDIRQVLPGRGFYVCDDAMCQEKIQKYTMRKPKDRAGKRATVSQKS